VRRFVPYLCLALWSTWLFALQGWWAAGRAPGGLVPDLGVVLLLGIAARTDGARARRVALVIALSRAALSADNPAALVLAYLAVALIAAPIAATLDLDRPWLRALLAALGGGAIALWLPFAADLRAPLPAGVEPSGGSLGWPVALATAVVALALSKALRALPGLGPLWREEGSWELAARGR